MKKPDKRRSEMLQRADEFGVINQVLFPQDSRAGRAFQVVHRVVTELGTATVTKLKTNKGGQYSRVEAREMLLKRLESVARLAEVIGKSKPGFRETFLFPTDTTDQGLVAAGRLFAHEIEVHMQDFGVPDTHLTGFTELTDALEQSVKSRIAGRTGQASARAAMAKALEEGMEAVRELDVVLPIILDPVTMAAWEEARRIDLSRRGRRAAKPAGETETPAPEVAPPAPLDPALKVAS